MCVHLGVFHFKSFAHISLLGYLLICKSSGLKSQLKALSVWMGLVDCEHTGICFYEIILIIKIIYLLIYLYFE